MENIINVTDSVINTVASLYRNCHLKSLDWWLRHSEMSMLFQHLISLILPPFISLLLIIFRCEPLRQGGGDDETSRETVSAAGQLDGIPGQPGLSQRSRRDVWCVCRRRGFGGLGDRRWLRTGGGDGARRGQTRAEAEATPNPLHPRPA